MILPTGEYVIVNHYRRSKNKPKAFFLLRPNDGLVPHARGGYTEVLILDKREGDLVARGEARCNPLDTYNKKLGREIALGRALKHLKGLQAMDAAVPGKVKKEKKSK